MTVLRLYSDYRKLFVVIMAATAFLINVVVKGTMKSLGFFLQALTNDLTKQTGQSSLVAAVFHLTFNCLSPFASFLCWKFGYFPTAASGLLISAIGLGLASATAHNIWLQILTIGVVFGTGANLSFTPGVLKVNRVFQSRNGLANGFSLAGNVVGGMMIPKLYGSLIETHSHGFALGVLAGIMACATVLTLTYSVPDEVESSSVRGGTTKSKASAPNFRISTLLKTVPVSTVVLLTLSQCFNAAGFLNFNNFVTMYFQSKGLALSDVTNLVVFQNLCDLVGRLVGPTIGDHFDGAFILLYSVGAVTSGLCISALSFKSELGMDHSMAFDYLVIGAVGYFSGKFIASWNSVLKEQVGSDNFGLLYNISIVSAGVVQFALTVLSGYLFDATSPDFLLVIISSFLVLSGICTIAVMILNSFRSRIPAIEKVKRIVQEDDDDEEEEEKV